MKRLLTKNPLFLERTKEIGILSARRCPALGRDRTDAARFWRRSRPAQSPALFGLRAVRFRCSHPTDGDTYARYLVRMEEMRQSLRIVQQALDKLPYGPVRSNNRKYVPPPRAELGTSMEAVIHHFKLWTEGFHAARRHRVCAVESPRGELGVYLESDGGPKPTGFTGARPPLPTCRFCPCFPKVIWWQTWSL